MSKKNVIPEGTRDLILKECVNKRILQNKIEKQLDKWGYSEVITPTIEFYQTYNSGYENLKDEDMYKFFDNKGRILVLKPDMTIPIARVAATKLKDMEPPLRLRYTANVFRVHESLGGKRNEYTDCGVELLGAKGKEADLEIILTAIDTLKTVDISNFKIDIGDISLFNSAVEELNLSEEERNELAQLINQKSLKELEDFLSKLNLLEEQEKFFLKLPWLFGGKEILEEGKKIAFNQRIIDSIEYLENLYEYLKKLGYENEITFDLAMVPRLNYYTGIIFRGYVEGIGSTVINGGRYDNLIKTFGRDLPSIGFSINVDSLLDLTKDNEVKIDSKYVVKYAPDFLVEALKKAATLREAGNIVELKLSKEVETIEVIGKEE